ncbi:hypothetical protein OG432_34795 [Streptomyces sp. NBC_00442]|uniref:hypothetical protein n=1 Tax=Streptomyces sp. NBC_00442 TaxID=2903651 RepID=UPI002E20B678
MPVAERWRDGTRLYASDEPEDAAIGRWLSRLSCDRVVHAPGLFAHHALEDGGALDFPAGIADHLSLFVVSGNCSATG